MRMSLFSRKPSIPTEVPRSPAAARRDEILDAAAQMFARCGYHDCDVEKMAGALGIGKGTIYRSFANKRALFLAAVDRAVSRMRAHIDAVQTPIDDPIEQIEAGTRAYLAYCDAHPEIVELLILERAVFKNRRQPTYFAQRDANRGKWRARIADLIAAGRVRSLKPESVLDVLSNAVYGTMFTNYFAGRKTSFARQAHDVLEMIFNGILAEPERSRRLARLKGIRMHKP